MKYFAITDYDYSPPRTERANIIIINDRRIYASDYETTDFDEIRIDGAAITFRFDGGCIRSTNWTTIYDLDVENEDLEYYKDFIRL